MATVYIKDPNDVLDYYTDWTRWLAVGETISVSVYTVPAGLTKDSESTTTLISKVRLSGGTAGTDYKVANKITTSLGQVVERSVVVHVEER